MSKRTKRRSGNIQLAGLVEPPPPDRGDAYWAAEYERMMDTFCFMFVFLLMIFAFAVIVFAALPFNWNYWIEGMEEQ